MKEMIHARISRRLIFIQALLGFGAPLFLALPYLRRTHGLDRLQPSQKICSSPTTSACSTRFCSAAFAGVPVVTRF
jgi:hypothetical protein